MPARAATPAVTEQLVFDLAPPEPPSFGNFLPGGNAEALAVVKALAAGEAGETGVMLWGAPGAGKTHLLRAAVAAVEARGRPAMYVATPASSSGTSPTSSRDRTSSRSTTSTVRRPTRRRGCSRSSTACASRDVISSSRAGCRWRRCRCAKTCARDWAGAWSTRSTPLADADKPAALAAYARGRGFALADDVIQYLLAHGRRDMAALVNALAALDRYSLSTKRPITVPLLRGWLQRDIDLGS